MSDHGWLQVRGSLSENWFQLLPPHSPIPLLNPVIILSPLTFSFEYQVLYVSSSTCVYCISEYENDLESPHAGVLPIKLKQELGHLKFSHLLSLDSIYIGCCQCCTYWIALPSKTSVLFQSSGKEQYIFPPPVMVFFPSHIQEQSLCHWNVALESSP